MMMADTVNFSSPTTGKDICSLHACNIIFCGKANDFFPRFGAMFDVDQSGEALKKSRILILNTEAQH